MEFLIAFFKLEEVQKNVLHMGSTIFIAVISSWIAIRLSFKKFRLERWWDKKVKVYSKVIEAFYNLKKFSDSRLIADYQGKKLTKEEENKLRQRSDEAHTEIDKTISIGTFLLSDEALSRLKRYQEESNGASKKDSWWDYLEYDLAATNKCLRDLIKIAKRDLKN